MMLHIEDMEYDVGEERMVESFRNLGQVLEVTITPYWKKEVRRILYMADILLDTTLLGVEDNAFSITHADGEKWRVQIMKEEKEEEIVEERLVSGPNNVSYTMEEALDELWILNEKWMKSEDASEKLRLEKEMILFNQGLSYYEKTVQNDPLFLERATCLLEEDDDI